MKNFFYLFFAFGILITNSANAAPGDTTWVQSHTNVQMDHFGNFDAPISFPSGSLQYRRIFMIFELGKYTCPGNPQYCYDWDYTVQNFFMNASGDTLELGRLITPYADNVRMPLSWRGKYVFDVTDYYPVLKNNAAIRVHYSGYSWGFTATVKFAFIEGTPQRNVVGIQKVWQGSYNYGHGSTPINTALGKVSFTAPAGTVSAESKFLITGHGGDASANAAEFYPNSYTMNLNNNPLVTQNFWRADCGFNNYYPQNGTWVYDRASWCPGDLVNGYSHTLTGIAANSNYTLNVTFPAYTSTPNSSGSLASYTIQNLIFYYAGLNKSIDASLEDIIAPTNDEKHFRENPFVGKPKVMVRNAGGTVITSIKFEYGVDGSALQQYIWNGNINSLQDATVILEECTSLKTATGNNNKFIVKILEVNGQADNDATNDLMNSYFKAAPVWNATLRMQLKTNAQTTGGVSENNWKIYDMNDNIIAQRVNNMPGTTYVDTVRLAGSSYRLVVEDAGCDGMNWWVFQFYNPNPGVASIQVRPLSSIVPIPMAGYFNGDFGCGFTQYFTTDPLTSIENVSETNAVINVYPNPANEKVTISVEGITVAGTLTISDAVGRIIYTEKTSKALNHINVSSLSNGMYFISYEADKANFKIQNKLMIAK